MPRSPEGVYSKPPGTNGGPPNTPISSAAYNNLMNDLVQDANTPRPVVAGGTGSNSALGGLDNLHTASIAIPASATTDLSEATGVSVLITGNSDIGEFGTVHAGATRVLTFEQALTLVYDADDTKIILPAPNNYSVGAGEVITMISEGDGVWRMASSSRGGMQKTAFLANKNGTGQNPPGNKITFTNEVFDIGGYYDAENSRWTPPAGKYFISVSAGHGMGPSGEFTLHIWKNGVSIATDVRMRTPSGFITGLTSSVSVMVEANGTDYFEAGQSNSEGNSGYSIDGQTTRTWFCGHAI